MIWKIWWALFGKKTNSASDTESKKKHGWDTPTENMQSFLENIETKRLELEMRQFYMDQDFRCEQIHQEMVFRTE